MTSLRTFLEYIEHLSKVLHHLHKHGLYAKSKKCEFHKKELSFLGYHIGPQGLGMEGNKVAAVSKLARATDSEGTTMVPRVCQHLPSL